MANIVQPIDPSRDIVLAVPSILVNLMSPHIMNLKDSAALYICHWLGFLFLWLTVFIANDEVDQIFSSIYFLLFGSAFIAFISWLITIAKFSTGGWVLVILLLGVLPPILLGSIGDLSTFIFKSIVTKDNRKLPTFWLDNLKKLD